MCACTCVSFFSAKTVSIAIIWMHFESIPLSLVAGNWAAFVSIFSVVMWKSHQWNDREFGEHLL